MNLVSKLIKKLKNIKESTKKRIIATALAGGIALSGLGMMGCNTTKDPGNTNPPIVNPGTPDYSSHSEIFQNVLTKKEYKNTIYSASLSTYVGESAEMDPNPYGFLQDQGYDIEKIKKGKISCHTTSFIKDEEPNNLYMVVNVDYTKTSYTQFLLKYQLTNQEVSDYKLLHGDDSRFYWEAVFLNNEISLTRKPVILATQIVDKERLEEMQTSFTATYRKLSDEKLFTNRAHIVITNLDFEKCGFDMWIFSYMPNNDRMTDIGGLLQMPCLSAFDLDIQNNIFYTPTDANGNFWFDCKEEDIPHSNITLFNSHETYLYNRNSKIYNDEMMKNNGI